MTSGQGEQGLRCRRSTGAVAPQQQVAPGLGHHPLPSNYRQRICNGLLGTTRVSVSKSDLMAHSDGESASTEECFQISTFHI